MMKGSTFLTVVLLAAAAAAAGIAVEWNWNVVRGIGLSGDVAGPSDSDMSVAGAAAAPEVLYWVAPMDPSYRSDAPGKSPMGMDLIPVYGDGGAAEDAGTVRISPAVINNLGVRTEQATREDIARRIETVGYIRYDETNISHVHLRIDGWIERLFVKSVGERVKKGELLFELYSPTLLNAQAEYLQARKAGQKLLMDASWARLQSFDISENQMQALVESGQIIERVRFYAPQDGVVSKLNVGEGMYVAPATTIMTLADLSTVWLVADVFESQADWVRVGQQAEVRLPYMPGKHWAGEVAFVYPDLDPKTRSLKVRLHFDNPGERLKPEMFADVAVFAAVQPDTVTVPREAVIRTGGSERVVVALGDGRFRAVEVVTGVESGDRVEILRGIDAGETVVTSAQFLIDSESSFAAGFQRMDDTERADGALDAGQDSDGEDPTP
jgi:membrane fusion protein, copper/silver efflux system